MLNEGWKDQFRRMKRSHERLREALDGMGSGGSDEARDRLFHFFQDAYHLKDWIKNDPEQHVGTTVGVALQSARSDVEDFISRTAALTLCADLCNGSKHLVRRQHRGAADTGFSTQSVTVDLGAGTVRHMWTVEADGTIYDVDFVVQDIVDEWERWLSTHSLV